MDLAELLDHISSQTQVTDQAGHKMKKNVCRSGFFDPVSPHVQTSLLKPCAGFCKKIHLRAQPALSRAPRAFLSLSKKEEKKKQNRDKTTKVYKLAGVKKFCQGSQDWDLNCPPLLCNSLALTSCVKHQKYITVVSRPGTWPLACIWLAHHSDPRNRVLSWNTVPKIDSPQ